MKWNQVSLHSYKCILVFCRYDVSFKKDFQQFDYNSHYFLAQLQKMVRNCEPCVYARGALAIVFSNLDTFPIVCLCVPYKQLFTITHKHTKRKRLGTR